MLPPLCFGSNYAIFYLREILTEVKVTIKIWQSSGVVITEPLKQGGYRSKRSKLSSAGGFLMCKCNCVWKISNVINAKQLLLFGNTVKKMCDQTSSLAVKQYKNLLFFDSACQELSPVSISTELLCKMKKISISSID